MALPCEPCDCPDAYFRDNGTFKRTVLRILCETREVMENIVLTGGGTVTSTAGLTDSTDKRFCTDAEKVVIGNTSGTNTGDQSVASLGLTQTKIRSVGATFDGGVSAIVVGSKAYVVCPFAGTITGWNVTVSSGTATVDVWKIANGTDIPTVANTITAAAKPAIAANTNVHSTTLTGWTTSVAANDIIAFNVDAATATWLNVSIEITI